MEYLERLVCPAHDVPLPPEPFFIAQPVLIATVAVMAAGAAILATARRSSSGATDITREMVAVAAGRNLAQAEAPNAAVTVAAEASVGEQTQPKAPVADSSSRDVTPAAADIKAPPALESPPSQTKDSWTAAKWLDTVGVNELIGHLLLASDSDPCVDELTALKSLAASDESTLDELLRSRLQAGVGKLAHRIGTSLRKLASSDIVTAEQMQEKFLQDKAGLLSYGGLSTFFGGLEAKIGSPNPSVHDAMAREHTAEGGDRHEEYVTGNYGVATTSAIEWAFVVTPEIQPDGGWPVETKLVLETEAAMGSSRWSRLKTTGSARRKERRKPMPLSELKLKVVERSLKLQKLKEPPMTLDEAIGARLYTGPSFVKYNAVLRGLDSDVPFLRNQMIELCCPTAVSVEYMRGAKTWEEAKGTLKYEQARKELNTYTTTLHAINSSIVKLGKLTIACKVYRGISGRVLPEQFWKENEYGVKGGIEGAFMSTTDDREVAMRYAASGGAGFVFEIQQGMIDRGADISFLSQYEHEHETLFAPLTGLEVQGTRVDGSVLVVEVKLSVNLTSLTLEQVMGKRKKLVQDAVDAAVLDLREKMRHDDNPSEHVGLVSESLAMCMQRWLLSREVDWFNSDEALAFALRAITPMRLAMLALAVSGEVRSENLPDLIGEERDEITALPSWFADVPLFSRALQTLHLDALPEERINSRGSQASRGRGRRGCQHLSNLESVDGLSGCVALQELKLAWFHRLESLEGLSGCPSLQTLELFDLNHLKSMESLSGCAVHTLELADLSRLSSVDGLSSCPKLQTLTLQNCRSLESIQSLSGCAVQTLKLGYLSLASLEGLSSCPSLQTLTLAFLNSLESVDGLSGCSSLQTLKLCSLKSLASLDGLSGCSSLQTLTLEETHPERRDPVPMEALKTLPDLSNLTALNVTVPKRMEGWRNGGLKAFALEYEESEDQTSDSSANDND